ncbi:hypothetical protein ACFFWC_13230 [Plantactinospora siamensis]|uniref:Uncharacterized protein n=1 Tax=Plantactinospora siamensis TaxID=555372 RepID=A0ABV6P267_9ACTN
MIAARVAPRGVGSADRPAAGGGDRSGAAERQPAAAVRIEAGIVVVSRRTMPMIDLPLS